MPNKTKSKYLQIRDTVEELKRYTDSFLYDLEHALVDKEDLKLYKTRLERCLNNLKEV